MLNAIWIGLMLAAVILGALHGTLNAVVIAVNTVAKLAVTVAIGLVGMMSFWLGIMKLVEAAGCLHFIARLMLPILRRLFPEIPTTHPAMHAMVMNITANLFGLGNAATPFGIRAMEQLAKLNPHPEKATHAMCLFLAINTSSVQLIPATAIAILAANGDTNPTSIIIPTLIATSCSTLVAVATAKLCAKFSTFYANTLGGKI